jgi:hypothetical protein
MLVITRIDWGRRRPKRNKAWIVAKRLALAKAA